MKKLHLLFMALTLFLGTALLAQNSVLVCGNVTGISGLSVPVTIATVQGTMPMLNYTVYTDNNGSFCDTLDLITSNGWVQVSILNCDSTMVYADASYTGPFDNLFFTLLYCNNNMLYDCNGVLNGPDLPGTPCDDGDPNTSNDTWDWNCNCAGQIPVLDCNGVLNGPDVPGAPCDDGDPNTINDTWTSNCICYGDSINNWVDCLGVMNGPDVPGAPCDDNDPNTLYSYWDVNCVCVSDSSNVWVDCNGVVNGPDVVGAPCDDGDPNTMGDTWDWNCNCVGQNSNPCDATFYITQAYDSLQGPSPYEVWVYYGNNIGGTYLWDFGDGTTSTDPYPTHTYAGNGPYELCLTISAFGCTDTYCDTVMIDPNGILIPGQDGSSGFTINIFNSNAVGVEEVELIEDINIFPNPSNGVFELMLESKEHVAATIELMDLSGRAVMVDQIQINGGANRIGVQQQGLGAGTYLLRLSYGEKAITKLVLVN